MKKCDLLNKIDSLSGRSAWRRGVIGYAYEMAEQIDDDRIENAKNREDLETILLNGARNWSESSWGGCFDCYDSDIAERLCTPSELKKTRNGERRPNASEEWLDTQARALIQAARIVKNMYEF